VNIDYGQLQNYLTAQMRDILQVNDLQEMQNVDSGLNIN